MPDPIGSRPVIAVPTSTPAASSAAKTCTVQPGDTLYRIAQKTLGSGNRWPEIFALNKDILPAPEKLKAGMVLKLPATATTPPKTETPATRPPTTTGPGSAQKDTFERAVSLTFDDGPSPVNTPKVLDILKQYGAKATFFVTGQNAERHPELIRRIVAEGHAIGNHTYDHANLSKLNQGQTAEQLRRTQAAVDKALGYHYELSMVRPPYGALGQGARDAAKAANTQVVLWNVDSNDWRFKNDDAKILANVFSGSNSVYAGGNIVLFHDIHPQTVRILDDVLARLQKEGFDIERTDKLLARKAGKAIS